MPIGIGWSGASRTPIIPAENWARVKGDQNPPRGLLNFRVPRPPGVWTSVEDSDVCQLLILGNSLAPPGGLDGGRTRFTNLGKFVRSPGVDSPGPARRPDPRAG